MYKRIIIVFILALGYTTLHAQKVQSGIASYYTKKWTGRKTASGERLHHDSMTCAHLKHPFGTLLKVTLHSDPTKSVVVKVNDRGPYSRGRIIDLSWGAARDLGILTKGLAKVTVEKYVPDTVTPKPISQFPIKWGADTFMVKLPLFQ